MLLFLYLLHNASTRWPLAAAPFPLYFIEVAVPLWPAVMPRIRLGPLAGGLSAVLSSHPGFRVPSSEYYELIRLPANHWILFLFVDISYRRSTPGGVGRASQVPVRLSSFMPRAITPVSSPYLAKTVLRLLASTPLKVSPPTLTH